MRSAIASLALVLAIGVVGSTQILAPAPASASPVGRLEVDVTRPGHAE